MQNAGLDEAQTGNKIARRNIKNPRYTDDTTPMAESNELNNLLMKVKEESEKAGLKLNIQRRSQDGRGIGRGDHFLSYKFIGRTTER